MSKENDSNWKVFKGAELSNEEYHGEKEHSSSSNIKDLITDRPSRWHKDGELWGVEKYHKEKVLGDKPEQASKNSFDEGSLAHCLILEPWNLDNDFAIYQGFRKSGNDYKAFKAAEEAGKGRIIVSKSQFKKVEGWVNDYKLNETAVNLIKGCETEYSLFGELKGMKLKVRADAINIEKGYIADVKTTAYDVDQESFANTVKDFKYQLSGAMYAKMFSEYYGKPFDFYFIVLGKGKGGGTEVYKLGDDSVRDGMKMVNAGLAKYTECKASGIWKNNEIKLDKIQVNSYDNYEILEV